ncbi:hypothetical protein FQA39_LY05531 [Lamprigera yunnana]|nr:hypothetical protein FQA39_LY05531 [Lamprigera yunnana]
MRKILRDLISKENVGALVTADSFKPDIHNEISICFLEVKELRDMLRNVQECSKSVALLIEAGLHHIFEDSAGELLAAVRAVLVWIGSAAGGGLSESENSITCGEVGSGLPGLRLGRLSVLLMGSLGSLSSFSDGSSLLLELP